MKITQLDIEGFRSLKKVSWKPGDLNVVIGPNGSGKSNLLRMLELISFAAQGYLSKYVQGEGGIGALVWDGQSDSIRFAIEAESVHEKYTLPGLAYEVNWPHSNFDVVLSRLGTGTAYRVQREILTDLEKETPLLERAGLKSVVYDGDIPSTLRADNVSDEELTLPIAAGPFSNSNELPYFKTQLMSWMIYQDIFVNRNAIIRQAAISRVEDRVASDGQNLVNVLHTLYTSDRNFKQDINEAMLVAFGDDFDELIFPPVAEQRIELQVRWKTLKRPQSAASLSDGTLRFLFLLTVLAAPNPPSLIAIDEPEAGLHPSMLPIIAEFAVDAAQRTQVIFTTHSDQFLDAFTGTKPTTTVAKWVDGETSLHTISGASLDYWLEGYSLGSLFRSGELEDME